MSRTGLNDARNIELHKMLADWGEGTSVAPGEEGDGAPATTNDATWRHRFFDTIFWTTEGGDFSATVSASQSVGPVGMYTWSSSQMRADVQSWLDDPASNFGWLVLGDESEISTAKRFDTRESASPPVLTIIYRPAGPRPTPTPRPRPFPRLRRVHVVRRRRRRLVEVRRFFSAVTLFVTIVRTAASRTICVAAGRLEHARDAQSLNRRRPNAF